MSADEGKTDEDTQYEPHVFTLCLPPNRIWSTSRRYVSNVAQPGHGWPGRRVSELFEQRAFAVPDRGVSKNLG